VSARVALVYAVVACIWGTTWFAIRRCIGEGGYPTLESAALRFAIAAGVLGALYAAGRGRPGPKGPRQLWGLAACGVLCAIGYALVYLAEESISGGLAAVLYGTFPLWTALFATAGGVERVTGRALAGSLLAIGGTAFLFADRLEVSHAQGKGVLFVLASVVASALYTTLMKRIAAGVSPLASTGVFLGTSAMVLGATGAIVERRALPWPPPPGPTLALLYLALVGSVVVFAAYFWLLERVSLMMLSTLVLVEPIIALAVDAVWERGVVLVGRSYLGIALTIAGIGMSIARKPKT
jgi:drug/metabolite transporter (DMT)-like permease